MHKERTAVFALALIMTFRMLGLFMILPVFSVHALQIPGATPSLIGLALGIYGLTQACLQMPFGALSDRFGRKPLIAIGLILFILGSIIAAITHSITGIIIGRALQGAGAIGSTILATVADLTCDENRSKAMATIGLTIGMAFAIAMIIGPIVNAWWHLSGIFWLTALLAMIGILLLKLVPHSPKLITHTEVEATPNKFRQILRHPQLLRLDLGIFSLHTILTALFIAIPILLTHQLKLTQFSQVVLYLTVLVVAFIIIVPMIIVAEKRRKIKPFFLSGIITLFIVTILLALFENNSVIVGIILFIFFTAFTLLESLLPSLISKIAPIRAKGTAMGVYSTSQFLGIFIGGSLGGVLFASFGMAGIFIFCGVIAFCWLLIAISMAQPPYLSTLILEITKLKNTAAITATELKQVNGVAEVALMPNENLLYLKIDKQIISIEQIHKLAYQSH